MRRDISTVSRDRFFELRDCLTRHPSVEEVLPLQVVVVRLEVLGPSRDDRALFPREQPDLQRSGDREGDLVLDFEDVLHLPVVPLGPEVIAVRDAHELGGDAEAGPGAADAPFQHRSHPELGADSAHVLVLPFEGESRGARGDAERLDLRQRVDDLLRDAVAEVLVLRVGAHVPEREHRDRGARRVRRGRSRGGGAGAARRRAGRLPLLGPFGRARLFEHSEDEREVARRLEPLVPLFLEAPRDDAGQGGGRRPAAGERGRVFPQDRRHALDLGLRAAETRR